jgi:hypothetical protein
VAHRAGITIGTWLVVIGGIKSIAIPLFENQTLESGVPEKLTDKLAEAFVTDNTLRVVPEGRSDSVLRGSVVSYKREAYTYNEAEAVSEYIVRIEVRVLQNKDLVKTELPVAKGYFEAYLKGAPEPIIPLKTYPWERRPIRPLADPRWKC